MYIYITPNGKVTINSQTHLGGTWQTWTLQNAKEIFCTSWNI